MRLRVLTLAHDTSQVVCHVACGALHGMCGAVGCLAAVAACALSTVHQQMTVESLRYTTTMAGLPPMPMPLCLLANAAALFVATAALFVGYSAVRNASRNPIPSTHVRAARCSSLLACLRQVYNESALKMRLFFAVTPVSVAFAIATSLFVLFNGEYVR